MRHFNQSQPNSSTLSLRKIHIIVPLVMSPLWPPTLGSPHSPFNTKSTPKLRECLKPSIAAQGAKFCHSFRLTSDMACSCMGLGNKLVPDIGGGPKAVRG